MGPFPRGQRRHVDRRVHDFRTRGRRARPIRQKEEAQLRRLRRGPHVPQEHAQPERLPGMRGGAPRLSDDQQIRFFVRHLDFQRLRAVVRRVGLPGHRVHARGVVIDPRARRRPHEHRPAGVGEASLRRIQFRHLAREHLRTGGRARPNRRIEEPPPRRRGFPASGVAHRDPQQEKSFRGRGVVVERRQEYPQIRPRRSRGRRPSLRGGRHLDRHRL